MTAFGPAQVARTYFRAWAEQDFDLLRSILADDVTFRGPLGTAGNAEECVAGLRGMSRILSEVVIEKMFVDGPDVLTWFQLHTTVAAPAPTANWSHITDGKINAIRVTFDPRQLVRHG